MAAILFDLDGVLYEGARVIDGAVEAVDWVIRKNIPHLFLTNTSSKPRTALVDKLASFGIQTTIDQFLTPPLAAINILNEHHNNRLALFISDATKQEFESFSMIDREDSDVDAVVVGDLAEDWSFETLNRAFQLLMDNPEANLIALGMTRYWKTEHGLQLDAGPFVKALEYATEKTAIVAGKPAAAFYQSAIALLGEEKIVMVGDDIRGDIEAAQAVGLQAVQVKTGKFTPADLDVGVAPDDRIDSIADLPSWWER